MSPTNTNITSALLDLAPRISAELYQNILPFWSGPAIDHTHGGWMGWLANDLTPDRSQPKGLVLHSRILWTFSAAFQARPDPIYQSMAERAFDYLIERFYDRLHGGAFWSIDDRGEVQDASKHIYGQAFFIYGLTEFYRGFGSQHALHLAEETFRHIEHHAHDSKHGGYFDHCQRDWSRPGKPRLFDFRQKNISKTMNTHLHILEAYSNLHRAKNNHLVALRLAELIDLFRHRILDPRSNHLQHDFSHRWAIRSTSHTFGHDIEASWLLCEAAEQLGPTSPASQARTLGLTLAAAVLQDGLAPSGGLYHEASAGSIIDPRHESWPQAEALIGFLNAYQLTGDECYAQAFQRLWQFIESNFPDPIHGEWHWRIGPDGQRDSTLPKVGFWKGPYHASRACLETLRRLETLHAAAYAGFPAASMALDTAREALKNAGLIA